MPLTLKELGEQLRQARESRNISLKEAAQITKIGPRILTAFEQGDLDKFPHRVYAKGFVKNYAKLLDLDPDECGRAVDQALDGPLKLYEDVEQDMGLPRERPDSREYGLPRVRKRRSPLGGLLLVVGLLTLLACLVWYLLILPGRSSQPDEAAQTVVSESPAVAPEPQVALSEVQEVVSESPEALPEVQETVSESPAVPAQPSVQDSPDQEVEVPEQAAEPSAVEAGAGLDDAAPADEPALPPGTHRLVIRALDADGSWIGVYALEADGKTRGKKLLKEHRATGTTVLDLTLSDDNRVVYRFGRIQGVALTLDGKPMKVLGIGTKNLILPPQE